MPSPLRRPPSVSRRASALCARELAGALTPSRHGPREAASEGPRAAALAARDAKSDSLAPVAATGLSVMECVEAIVDPLAGDEREEEAHLRRWLEAELRVDRGAQLEAASIFPARELSSFAQAGLMDALVPEDQGGRLDWSRAMRLASRFAAHDIDVTLCLGGMVLGAIPVLVAGTPAQRAQYFGPVRRGAMGGLALSEWAFGSDLLAGACAARPTAADGSPAHERAAVLFVLEGDKAPTNNGTVAENLVVLARTSDARDASSHTLFLVARGTPGLSPGPRFDSLGYRRMDLSGVSLRGARVSRDSVVGGVGEGFVVARRSLEISRSGVATMALGAHASALAHALAHAGERCLYGAPIAMLGGVRSLLARTASALVVSTALVRRTARGVGAYGIGARRWSSSAKLLAPRLLERAVHDAGTILGARSLMNDLPFARVRRAAPVFAIFDGSSQLQLDELWRHAGTWGEASGAVDVAVADLYQEARRPFVADADDGGLLDRTSPPLVIAALGGDSLSPLAEAARAVHATAGALRGAPQSLRFRASELVALLYAVSATLEARERARSGARTEDADILDAALGSFLAAFAGEVAAGLVELGEATGEDAITAVGARALSFARVGSRYDGALLDGLARRLGAR